MGQLNCLKCDHEIPLDAKYCSYCGWQFFPEHSPSSETDNNVGLAERQTSDKQPLSAPLKLFGVLVLIPTAFALLNLEGMLDPTMFGFGLDLPLRSRILLFSESTLALLSLVISVGTLTALYGRKHAIRKFAIALLFVVPIRFFVQLMVAVDLKVNELAEVAFSGVFAATVMALIWIPYFIFSKRVKAIVGNSQRQGQFADSQGEATVETIVHT